VKHPPKAPFLVLADQHGNITEHPDLTMAGMSADTFIPPRLADLIPLPPGSELFALPGRLPVGFGPNSETVMVERHPLGGEARAVAAFMAPAHTMIHNAAWQRQSDAPTLPLFAFCAVGWLHDRFWVAGFRCDADKRQDLALINPKKLTAQTKKRLAQAPNNRLIQHLGKCCLTYGCPAARNYFLGRFEAPLPTSPSCNARCLGCISLQESGCCRSTQERITFTPSSAEIEEIAVPHLRLANSPVVSFGQGCEGEPLLQAALIEQSIIQIRRQTQRGTINLNSNSSRPEAVARLAAVGLDSLRVSLNSARELFYNAYYRPNGYRFADVKESIRAMKRAGRFVSLNYFLQPGLTDTPDEYEALVDFVAELRPDMIQLRNLNMDPEWYLASMPQNCGRTPMGIAVWLRKLRRRFPTLVFGYFNPCLNRAAA
jgi:pyruvate-formate lyase-activating enzyme